MTVALIATLEAALPKLNPKDRKFGADLIAAYKKYGHLTPKQEPWVAKLVERATAPKPEPMAIPVGNFAGVIALFAEAKKHLKFPKVVLSLDGTPIWLAVAGKLSKAPGSVNIMGEGKYPDRPWYGRVSADGTFTPSMKVAPEVRTKLVELLTKFGENPARVAKAYGKLTGNCCFCHKALGLGEDQRSVKVGFGPVCAEHYGLKAQWLAAADQVWTTEAVAAAVEELGAIGAAVTDHGPQSGPMGELHPSDAPGTCAVCGEPVGANWQSQEGLTLCVTCAGVLAK